MTQDSATLLLIERIRHGEEEAWSEFINLYEGRLLAFARSRIRNNAAAEDIVQEAFLGFLTSLPNYDPATKLETYLFTITSYKLTDHLRREGRRPALSLTTSSSSIGSHDPVGRARRASSLMQSREGKQQEGIVIAECLAGLIEQWQEQGEYERLMCMELLFVLGWPNKRVAEELDITEQAVANHKHFTLSKLKEAAMRSRVLNFDLSQFGIESI
ncbi:RNA polymerase sigma factor CarQ [Polystyrenella longa]|uniref:RNA polymerase sigma factor CarQ n=1 Tax=Polystyrenella longa TaxID=2528007 RepID=A0A518CHF4_9PLAN|nr:sigma-70 family RNA polymerase sigma factor [Polystyrenella longa]QDU78652.1 RNA polymerase sigma factor CarQ [Polystyrenella longa]